MVFHAIAPIIFKQCSCCRISSSDYVGEVGIDNFFIDHIDFGNKNFSGALYNWDFHSNECKKRGAFSDTLFIVIFVQAITDGRHPAHCLKPLQDLFTDSIGTKDLVFWSGAICNISGAEPGFQYLVYGIDHIFTFLL